MALKRLTKELRDLEKSKDEVFSLSPKSEDLFHWTAELQGPKGSPYEGGVFKLAIEIPQSYPMEPPEIVFETKVYHPNISDTGDICLDTLSDMWSPALTLGKVMLSISSLLTDPNPDDPLEPDIADEYNDNLPLFIKNAKAWTLQHATPKEPRGTKRKLESEEPSAKSEETSSSSSSSTSTSSSSSAPSTSTTSDTTSTTPTATSTPASTPPVAKKPCVYGAKCYRKNPQHFEEYSH